MRILGLILFFTILTSSERVCAQNWLPLLGGLDKGVRTMFADTVSNKLYVGGHFLNADGITVNHIASWDGNNWDSLASGATMGYNGYVTSFTNYNGSLYATGTFFEYGNWGVAKWTGTYWDTVIFRAGNVQKLWTHNNELYVVGWFDTIAGVTAQGVVKWNGTNWSNIDNTTWSLFGGIFNITEYQGQLYIGGNFANSNYSIRGIAKWNGNSWEAVGTGLGGGVGVAAYDFVEWNNELYVAGEFCMDAGGPGNGIAKWDGTSWSDVGGGVFNAWFNGCPAITDLQLFNNELWAVGYFTDAGGVPALTIAKWDGSNWCGLGIDFDEQMAYKLAVYNNELYVGGSFVTGNSDTLNYIAKWNGGSFVDTCGNTAGITESYLSAPIVSVYPNPFSTSTTIEITGINEAVTLCVYDQLGREVKRIEGITVGKHELSREGLSSGLYYYSLNNQEGRIAAGKLIVY